MSELNKYNCLFLDRDGVINVERPHDYAKNKSEFVFIAGVLEAIRILSAHFEQIFIVTNQRGIGRGVMTMNDLNEVHTYMLSEIEKAGGFISKIYFCPDIDVHSINRKPNIGMGFRAKEDFPNINFAQSVFVGNSRSDMEFAKKLEIYSVLVGDKYPKEDKIHQNINAYYENLHKFAEAF